jgi:iron complex outermembrane recepter protein
MITNRNSEATRRLTREVRSAIKLALIMPLVSLGTWSGAANAAAANSSAEPQSSSDQNADVAAGTQPATASSPVLREVIVSAQKRQQNLQKVPIAITALSGDKLTQIGVSNTLDIASASPGVVTSAFGENGTSPAIYIRGVGQLDFAPHQESPTALYVDDAYISFLGATYLGLYDVNQFSVLRGPQGTLFGRNATAGVIQIQTNDPTDYFTGYFQQTDGSFDQITSEGAISGPLSDNLDARFAFQYNRNSGWFNNNLGPSVGSAKTLNMRLKLLYKFGDNTRDLLEPFYSRAFPMAAGGYLEMPAAPNPANAGLSQNTDGPLFTAYCYSAFGVTNLPKNAGNCEGWVQPGGNPFRLSFQEYDPRVGRASSSLSGITNTLTTQMPWAKFTSITNYATYGMQYIEDDSDDYYPIVGYGESADAFQISEEARLNGDTSSMHWVAGVYALHIRGDYSNVTPLFPSNNFSNILDLSILTGSKFPQGVWTEALFGQTDYQLSDKLSVIVGARLERDSKWADMTQFCNQLQPVGTYVTSCAYNYLITGSQSAYGNVSTNEWSGNVTFNYQIDPDTLAYVGIRRGTKGGEVDANTYPEPGSPSVGPPLTFNDIYVRPEILTDTEGGIKTELLNHRLRLNGDAFYYHYSDYQAEQFVDFADLTFNAQARDYGAEFSADALVTPTVTANLGFAYLHTVVYDVPMPNGTFRNQVQPLAPNISVTFDLKKEWREPFGTFFAAGNLTYVGSRYFGSVNQPELLAPAYTETNVSAGYDTPNGKLNFTLSVKNLTDRVIIEDIFDVVSSGGYAEYNIAPPRWVSLTARYNF